LPTPGEAKAKAMPGRLYIYTRPNEMEDDLKKMKQMEDDLKKIQNGRRPQKNGRHPPKKMEDNPK
jgi:hypothetical protein